MKQTLMLIAAIATCSSAMAQTDTKPKLKIRIAVNQGKWDRLRMERWNIPAEVSEGLQASLVDKLHKSGSFIVMERETTAMSASNQEQAIHAQSSATKPMQKTIAASYILTPEVISFEFSKKSGGGIRIPGLPVSLGGGKQKMELRLAIRISSAETSELLDTEEVSKKQEQSDFSIGIDRLGNFNDFSSTPLGKVTEQALTEAVEKVAKRLQQESWSASVAAYVQQTNKVILNAGEAAGVSLGMEFDVYQTTGVVTDNETGAIISKGDEIKIARVKVTRVEKGAAFCSIISGKGIVRGNVVRLAGQTP